MWSCHQNSFPELVVTSAVWSFYCVVFLKTNSFIEIQFRHTPCNVALKNLGISQPLCSPLPHRPIRLPKSPLPQHIVKDTTVPVLILLSLWQALVPRDSCGTSFSHFPHGRLESRWGLLLTPQVSWPRPGSCPAQVYLAFIFLFTDISSDHFQGFTFVFNVNFHTGLF